MRAYSGWPWKCAGDLEDFLISIDQSPIQPLFKTIQAANYSTKCFRAFGDTLFIRREHRFAGPARDIDSFGNCWNLILCDFPSGQIALRRKGRLLPVSGP